MFLQHVFKSNHHHQGNKYYRLTVVKASIISAFCLGHFLYCINLFTLLNYFSQIPRVHVCFTYHIEVNKFTTKRPTKIIVVLILTFPFAHDKPKPPLHFDVLGHRVTAYVQYQHYSLGSYLLHGPSDQTVDSSASFTIENGLSWMIKYVIRNDD